jgi:hypothetical protein
VWLSTDIVKQVQRVARIYYVDKTQTKLWNDNRRGNELRMFTGWMYVDRRSGEVRQGMKTQSVAIREAFYAIVQKTASPNLASQKPRIVSSRRVA